MSIIKRKKWLMGVIVLLVLVGAVQIFNLLDGRRVVPEVDRDAMTPQRGMEKVTYGYTQALEDYKKAGSQEGADRITLTARDAILEGDARLEESNGYDKGDLSLLHL